MQDNFLLIILTFFLAEELSISDKKRVDDL